MIALYWLWRLGMFLVGLAPRRLSHAAAGWIGTGYYYLVPHRRRIARNNFSHVLKKSPRDLEVHRVARESFRNYARLLRDVMIFPGMAFSEIEQRVTILSPEHFSAATARGKGAIIVSAHFGNMDLPGAVIATRFKPVTLVSETLKPPPLMDYIVRMRAQHRVQMYEYDRAPRQMLSALRRNEFVGMLMDLGVTHHFDMTTVEIDFFGTPTRFTAGPAQVALLTGAAIIVGAAFVAPDAHIQVATVEPFVSAPTGNRKRDYETITQEVGKRLEFLIRQKPEQWYIFRPMWENGYSAH
ncbi:MAG: hypothetical protein HY257_10825 [Chloroflexi bacterium]|nr:hypothetical protein [Chloroflexota bacterium]